MQTEPSPRLSIDYEAFARDLAALRAEVDASLGPDDIRHLEKLERWGRACTGIGYATAWLGPNPLSAVLMSLGNTTRWTIVTHHVSHRSLDRIPGAPARLTSKVYGRAKRRFADWPDWILPEAWHHEHNVVHHYHTGEVADPDLVEQNLDAFRKADLPLAVKYAVMTFFAFTWKASFYAPSTFQSLRHAERRRATRGTQTFAEAQHGSNSDAFDLRTAEGRSFWKTCLLPYAGFRFGALPLAFSPLGPWAVFSVFANSVAAEFLTNLHTFAIITPNHAGEDVYRFDEAIEERAEFFVRQVLGSVNYRTGGDVNDFFHGFLNYQIEHHLFPDLPPLKYQQIQPRVKAICEKHGVPYVQESVFTRVRKFVDVAVGKASMLRAKTSARAAEPQAVRPRPMSVGHEAAAAT